MRKSLLFLMSFIISSVLPIYAHEDDTRIKSLEEKVELLTKQLGLDKVDTLEQPEEQKLTFKEKYDAKSLNDFAINF